ncbi:ELMOD1 [Bugula neritina]|uniref:ELMOD1 n=1 Tax=Bugula neritina TaxID=10212 RepID=A0A7J7J8T5_BUGNE|nr:ELMOD1 [Bugula neritina]
MYKLIAVIGQFLVLHAWPMFKWILHKVKGQCELLRIQYEEQPGYSRTQRTERSLKNSKFTECHEVIAKVSEHSLSDRVSDVSLIKGVVYDKHPVFRRRFTECVERILGYTRLVDELERLRTEKYEEGKHQQQLLNLWKTLKPDEPLSERYTRQWGDIGFQGTDPASDFRGMGLLGLLNLIYFSEEHCDVARQTVMHSNHPKYGYSFAIVGINLTEMCIRYMRSGLFKRHFYNLESANPTVQDFNELYCYVFVEFDKLWMKEKPNIMQFNAMRDKYEGQLDKC